MFKFKRKQLVTGIVAATIIIAGYVIYTQISQQDQFINRRPSAPNELWLQAQKVSYATESFSLKYSGKVISSDTQQLKSFVSGNMEKGTVALKKGQTFLKGDVLFRISEKETLLSLKSSRSRFKNLVSAILPDLKTMYPTQFEQLNRYFTEINLEEKIADLPEFTDYKLNNFLNQKNLYTSYFDLQKEELNLEYLSYIAPFDGVVSELAIELGARVTPGTTIGEIVDTSQLEIEISIPQEESHLLNINSTGLVIANNTKLQSRLTRKSPLLSKQTLTQSIYVQPAAAANLLIGDYVDIEFPNIELTSVLKVPRNLISNSGLMKVIDNRTLKEMKVTRVLDTDEFTYVKGINEDFYFVTQQLINISMNQEVKIIDVDNAEIEGR